MQMRSVTFLALVASALAVATASAGHHDPTGVRALLSALQLKPVSGPMVDTVKSDVFDFAVYQATGDRRLATLFGTAA